MKQEFTRENCIAVGIWMTKVQHALLREMARSEHISVSALVRDLLDYALRKEHT